MEAVFQSLRVGIFAREILSDALLLRGNAQNELFKLAQDKRIEYFTRNEVEERSVIELSNICQQGCNYCTMGKNSKFRKYSIDGPTLISLVESLYKIGRRVFLFQSGENNKQNYINRVAESVEKIKSQWPDCIIILCLGNLSRMQYLQLRRAGADRYVLKFETSNPVIYKNAKPNDTLENRIRCMDYLLECGFELGSGNIVGLPGQKLSDVVDDILLIHRYNLTMNSSTVFIPAETSVFSNEPIGDINTTLNTMALMRIMNPHRLMPATSSLEKAEKGGQLRGLLAGANTVTIHDGTMEELKDLFPIYSTKRVIPQKKHFNRIVKQANLKFSKEARYFE